MYIVIIDKTKQYEISIILAKLTDTISKTDKQEEKLTELSYKLSTYEDHMDNVIINKMKQPLPLQVKNDKDEKITYISSKLSTYGYCLEKLIIAETQI